MSAFRLVTFDVTNTLLHFKNNVGSVYCGAAALYSKDKIIDCDQVEAVFRKSLKRLLVEHPNFGAHSGLTSEKWWSLLVRRTLSEASSPNAFSDDQLSDISNYLYNLYQSKECWDVLPGAPQLLQRIKSSGAKLGIISNFDDRLNAILNSTALLGYFDFVLHSRKAGVTKPDKRIYEMAVVNSGGDTLPSECIHIGDDVANDYHGAKNAGWNALLFVKNGAKDDGDLDFVRNTRDIGKRIFLN